METLEILHDVESYLGRDLTTQEDHDLIEYLNDDPMDTEPQYLTELFNLDRSS